jgi:hypothetical protein
MSVVDPLDWILGVVGWICSHEDNTESNLRTTTFCLHCGGLCIKTRFMVSKYYCLHIKIITKKKKGFYCFSIFEYKKRIPVLRDRHPARNDHQPITNDQATKFSGELNNLSVCNKGPRGLAGEFSRCRRGTIVRKIYHKGLLPFESSASVPLD